MKPAFEQLSSPYEGVTFRDILVLTASHWRWIVAGICGGLVFSFIYLWTAVPRHDVAATLAPAAHDGGSQANFPQGLIGISLGAATEAQPFERFFAAIYTRTLAARLEAKYNILGLLYPNGDIQPGRVSAWLGATSRPADIGDLEAYIERTIAVSSPDRSNLRSISGEFADPDFGKWFLTVISEEANQFLREEAQNRAEDYSAYIREKLGSVTIMEHKSTLVRMLSEQEQKLMMAAADVPFAATMFDPPYASRSPTSPRILPVLLMGLTIGGLTGTIIGFAANQLRRSPGQRA